MSFNCKTRRRVSKSFEGVESLTEQCHKDRCEMRHVLKKFEATGVVQHVSNRHPTYGNYIGAPDFQEAQFVIASARSTFQSIPARIRARFKNDVSLFLDFVTDEKNRDEIVSMGFDVSHLPAVEKSHNSDTSPLDEAKDSSGEDRESPNAE